MSDTCPTCGQPTPDARANALMGLLRDHRRQVYRINQSTEWAVTSSPKAVRFPPSVVRALAAKGLLAPVYPGTEAAEDCYGDASFYGRPSYVQEIQWRIAQRDSKRLAKSALSPSSDQR